MSKLDELIKELCPNGVEYQPISDICETITDYTAAGSFADVAKNVKYINNGVGYAQLIRTTDLKSKFENRDKFVYVDEHAFNYLWRVNLNVEGLILPNVGNCGEVYYVTKDTFVHEKNVLGPNSIWVRSNTVDNKYLYYIFLATEFQRKLIKIITTTGQTKFNKTNFKNLTVPVPPLEVQREIVRILDSFTLLTAELTAELTARKKQYEYYRDILLVPPCDDVEKISLSDVVSIKNGKDYKHLKDGKYPVYGSGGIMTYKSEYTYDKPSVLIPRKGSLSNLFYVEEPFWNVDTVFYTEVNESKLIPKYLYYLLQKEHLESLNTAGGVPSLTQTILNKLNLTIPSLNRQRKIVDCLDNFEKICNDLNIGLPAEIEARKKQYEYYRDVLLTFAETGSTILTDRQTDRQTDSSKNR